MDCLQGLFVVDRCSTSQKFAIICGEADTQWMFCKCIVGDLFVLRVISVAVDRLQLSEIYIFAFSVMGPVS